LEVDHDGDADIVDAWSFVRVGGARRRRRHRHRDATGDHHHRGEEPTNHRIQTKMSAVWRMVMFLA
jgi:hypothetical protein